MPDVLNSHGVYGPEPDPPRDWATVTVPPGTASVRAAKDALLVPADVQILDPSRKRLRCEEPHCYREAHERRQLPGVPGEDAEPVDLCPAHARLWDRDAALAEVPVRGDAVSPTDAPDSLPEPEVAPTPAPTVYRARTARWLDSQGFTPVARKDMPSRSKEARHQEWLRRKARLRRAASAGG